MKFKRAQWVLVSVLVAGAFVAGWHLKARGGDAAQETSKTDAAPKHPSFRQEEYIHPLGLGVMVNGGVSSLNLSVGYVGILFGKYWLQLGGDDDYGFKEMDKLLGFGFKERDGRSWVRWEGEHGAYIEYIHIGTSPSGVEIVEYRESGGGTGVFCDVALFKIATEKTYWHIWQDTPEKEERTILKILGTINLGDRYKGRIVYEDGVLHIPVSEGRFGPGGPRGHRGEGSPLSVPIP